MAEWKKVIVSGSTANLANVQVDGLTSGQVVIGGGTAGNLTTTAINGTGNIVATTGATGVSMSGSFSGSFFGNGAGLTGVTATFPVTAKTDLASTDQFFINDGVNKFVTYGNLLTDLAGTNLAVEGTDSLRLASTISGDTTFSNSVVIAQNLTVQGTASFQNTTNLEVADRFVLFASGSNTAGDGGIVIQQGIQNVGELYGYENSINRWGFTSSFNASSPNFTAAAFITTTETSTAVPSAAPLYGGTLAGFGNIHVKTDTGDIYIYA
jgi:hypothetical protein